MWTEEQRRRYRREGGGFPSRRGWRSTYDIIGCHRQEPGVATRHQPAQSRRPRSHHLAGPEEPEGEQRGLVGRHRMPDVGLVVKRPADAGFEPP